jgi:galactokinase
MTGAGFGGCAVALAQSETAEALAADVATAYREQTGLEPGVYVCEAAEGAEAIAIDP